jgi:TonB family protein
LRAGKVDVSFFSATLSSLYMSFSSLCALAHIGRNALIFWALLMTQPAFAQSGALPKSPSPVVDTTTTKTEMVIGQLYTSIEQMPQLPGGGGTGAIVNAIQRQIKYPPVALRKLIEGRVTVSFTVGKNGAVRDPKIVQGIGSGCDEAVLAAVQGLPRFIPGTQEGQPVPVGFTVPITFRIPPALAVEVATDSTRFIYTMASKMPDLPGGGGTTAIAKAVQQVLRPPAEVPAAGQPNKVFVSFTVGPSGTAYQHKIVRGLTPACDAAALAAVRQLPRFVGGQLNGHPVAVSLTVPVVFERPKP